MRDGMTGSSSDDSILLVLRLQPLLITLNHNNIAISHTFSITPHTDLLSPFPPVSTITLSLWINRPNLHDSLTAPSRTALVPIRFSNCRHTALRAHGSLPISKCPHHESKKAVCRVCYKFSAPSTQRKHSPSIVAWRHSWGYHVISVKAVHWPAGCCLARTTHKASSVLVYQCNRLTTSYNDIFTIVVCIRCCKNVYGVNA
jgi:hypothetical protein